MAASIELGPSQVAAPSAEVGGRGLSWWRRVALCLPTGGQLDDDAYAARHRFGLVALAIVTVIVTITGALGEWRDHPDHLLVEISPLILAGYVAWRFHQRVVATLSTSFGLMMAAATFVHLTDGLIEAHFLFYLLFPVIALYQDWRAFLGTICFVLLHHATLGTTAPHLLYNHPSALAHPVQWGLIHTVFVTGLVVVMLVAWNLSEHEQRQTRKALADLTDTRRELVGAQKLEAMGQLAAGIAHEINTPMQYIGDNTHFLKASVERLVEVADAAALAVDEARSSRQLTPAEEELATLLGGRKLAKLTERAPKAADDALDGVENVTRIVKAMKRFSHPGDDRAAVLDLNESINSASIVCRNEWKYVADVEINLDPNLPLIEGFLGSLNQVWVNMIVNASHAIAARTDRDLQKGTIRIETRSRPDEQAVEVVMADNGTGIPPENLERVFEHFFTTKDVGIGTGQGLSVAHQIVVIEHGGRINVESTVGEGTCFRVTLPVSQSRPPDESGCAVTNEGEL